MFFALLQEVALRVFLGDIYLIFAVQVFNIGVWRRTLENACTAKPDIFTVRIGVMRVAHMNGDFCEPPWGIFKTVVLRIILHIVLNLSGKTFKSSH